MEWVDIGVVQKTNMCLTPPHGVTIPFVLFLFLVISLAYHLSTYLGLVCFLVGLPGGFGDVPVWGIPVVCNSSMEGEQGQGPDKMAQRILAALICHYTCAGDEFQGAQGRFW